MEIGISVCSSYGRTDPRLAAAWMVERAEAAASAGLSKLFVGDHHNTPTVYMQNVPVLGRMLAEWDSRPAGALFLLPLWHPVLLAEQIGSLAAICQGRFIMQCGLGGEPHTSAAFGSDHARRVGMFNESLRIMRELWAGETVSAAKYWQIEEARIEPVPSEPVEVWLAGSADPAIERAARVADGWLGSPGSSDDHARHSADVYRAACAAEGVEVGPIAMRKDVCVAPTSQAAKKACEPYLAKGYRGIDQSALVIGSPAQVTDQLAPLAEAGYTDILIRNICREQDVALQTIELMGEVVV